LGASSSETRDSLEIRFFLQVVLCSNMWLLKALRRLILPLPVARKRFEAALRVLSFGINLRGVLIISTQSSILSATIQIKQEEII